MNHRRDTTQTELPFWQRYEPDIQAFVIVCNADGPIMEHYS